MDNKAIALVLIALLVGLGGGYGLGYVIYQPQLQTIQNEISGLHDELDNAEDRIRDLNSTLNGLQSSVSTLNTELGTADSDIASLQSQLTDLNAELATINSALSDLESSITAFNAELDTINSAISDLQSSVTDLYIIMDVLNATFINIATRSWHSVWASSGSANLTSGLFQLRGEMFQLSWAYNALYVDCWIEVSLCFQNGTACWINGSSGIYGAFDSEGSTGYFGQYYLRIRVSDYVYWGVAIYDFY